MKSQDIISVNTALLTALIVLSMFQFGFCSQVWVGTREYISILDMGGNCLSSFNFNSDVGAIEVVPEPATLLLLGLGVVMLRKRKK